VDPLRLYGVLTELYVDANGGYTRKQALRMAAAWAEHDVRWFEEPVSSDDLVGLLFDGALAPDGGTVHPDQGRPGVGLVLDHSAADPYRRR
jgi:hypothetical protein